MRRQQSGPPETLSAFPVRRWGAEASFYRVSGRDKAGNWLSPWWFCSQGDCRFDLTGDAGKGTLYAGTNPITGVLEYLGDQAHKVVTSGFLAHRRVCELAYDKGFPLADFTSPKAGSFGVSNLLSASQDYDIAQSWADALSKNFDGILYRARFVTDGPASALAIFDKAGSHDWPIHEWRSAFSSEIVQALRDRGIHVSLVPALRDLDVID